ncbi:hypothetical protein ABZ235_04790 [Streptomyces canus]|uniref:hypothetical protein n=1 Tax=Streptomyces canus TaxID=58343 RepID=UPI0033A175AF
MPQVAEEPGDAVRAEGEPVEPAAPVTEAPAAGSRSPRRRGRTATLIAGAAVLGGVAGTCTGYLIQADREPTKLASLSQPSLAQAKGPAPEPLPASQDRRVKTDGDLRKLLLKKPAGAKAADWLSDHDGWLDLAAYAEVYEKPAGAFSDLVADQFRRAAVVGWETGNRRVTIRLVQYRQEESVVTADVVSGDQYWATEEPSTRSWAVPGTGSGMAYVHDRPDTEPGYLPDYQAEAHASRGDIVMEVWVDDTKPVSKKTIMDLAERQMERL